MIKLIALNNATSVLPGKMKDSGIDSPHGVVHLQVSGFNRAIEQIEQVGIEIDEDALAKIIWENSAANDDETRHIAKSLASNSQKWIRLTKGTK